MLWMGAAVLSAFFAGVTAILEKCGVKRTNPDLGTALRTTVVLAFSWLMVFVVGSEGTIGQIGARSFLFLILSGLATGASWICYMRALSMGDVSKVAAIDKSSVVLTVLLAIFLFHETEHLAVKLAGAALLAVGTLLMIEKKGGEGESIGTADAARPDGSPGKDGGKKGGPDGSMAGAARGRGHGWLFYAAGSAVFAALTSILAKVGIDGVESNLGTAIRTIAVLVMAWAIVFRKGAQVGIRDIDRKDMLFLLLSGITTGASWLCYYYAIQNGVVSVVVPIDKMSILVTVGFSVAFLHERLSRRAAVGLLCMACGTLAIALWG